MFDPYHKWLGISKKYRPPTYYQLLGVTADETDAEVIDEAAVRQTAHVRNYQIGAHAAEATRILNEISQAKLTLINPAKRKAYDQQLAKAAAEQVTATAPPPTRPIDFDLEDAPEPSRVVAPRSLNIARRRSMMPLVLSGVAGLVVLVAIGVALITWVTARPPAPPVVAVKKDDKKPEKPIVKGENGGGGEDKPNVKPPVVLPPILDPPPVVQPQPGQKLQEVPGMPGTRKFQTDEKPLRWLSVAPDGSKVAVSFVSPRVYDLTTGAEVTRFASRGFGGVIHTPVSFFPDNRKLLFAFGAEKGAAGIGDTLNGKVLLPYLERNDVQYASCLAVDRAGRRALVGHNYRLAYWDLENHREIKNWPTKGISQEIVFLPDGKRAFTGDDQGQVILWDDLEMWGASKDVRYKVSGKIEALAASPDGVTIASGQDRAIVVFDVKERRSRNHNNPDLTGAVAFIAGGKQLVAGCRDGSILILDVPDFKLVARWNGHAGPVTRIAVDAQEKIAVSSDNTGAVIVWPLPAGPVAAAANAPKIQVAAPPPGLKEIVKRTGVAGASSLSIMPDGESFLIGGLGFGRYKISGELVRQFDKRTHTKGMVCLAHTADGRLAAWGELLAPPKIFEVATGQEIGALEHPGELQALALAPDGSKLFAAFDKRILKVWDVAKRQISHEVPLAGVSGMAVAPDGKHMFMTKFAGKALWVNTTTWQPEMEWPAGPYANSPVINGQTASLVSAHGVHVFDLKKLQPVAELQVTHPDAIMKAQHAVTCAGGALALVLVRNEQKISVWDLRAKEQVTAWQLPEIVHCFGVDVRETFAVAATRSGSAYFWPLPKTRADLK